MKKLIVIVATLLSSMMLRAQNYIELWGTRGTYSDFKKSPGDSLLYLTKGSGDSFILYKKGKQIDQLDLNKQFNMFSQVKIRYKKGRYFINDYEILMDDKTKEALKKYWNQQASSHYSHGSHQSHYSHYSSRY